MISGTTNLYEVEDILKMELPTEEFDTLSGFVIGQLGYIPGSDEQPVVEYENIIFSVDEMMDKRIMKVRVMVKEEVTEEM
jgi:putative hemolysin